MQECLGSHAQLKMPAFWKPLSEPAEQLHPYSRVSCSTLLAMRRTSCPKALSFWCSISGKIRKISTPSVQSQMICLKMLLSLFEVKFCL